MCTFSRHTLPLTKWQTDGHILNSKTVKLWVFFLSLIMFHSLNRCTIFMFYICPSVCSRQYVKLKAVCWKSCASVWRACVGKGLNECAWVVHGELYAFIIPSVCISMHTCTLSCSVAMLLVVVGCGCGVVACLFSLLSLLLQCIICHFQRLHAFRNCQSTCKASESEEKTGK